MPTVKGMPEVYSKLPSEVVAALAAGANVNERARMNRTSLMYAAVDGCEEVARILLNAGARVDDQDSAGMSSLHFAAQESRLKIAQLLLSHGATVDLEDKEGRTPLFTATYYSRGTGDLITLLLGAGANPDHVNHHGHSPRSMANAIANFNVKQFFV